MTDVVNFNEVKLNKPLLTMLHEGQLFNRGTLELLGLVFEHGGYIAGGFAALVARHVVMCTPAADFYRDVVNHTGGPIKVAGWSHAFRRHGDIDVFFSSQQQLDGFLNDPRRSIVDLNVTPTVTGAGLDHIVDGDVKVQVITRWARPMKEHMTSFDIYNSMAGVTNEVLVMAEQWEALERAMMLHVTTWAGPWTVGRVFKYVNTKGYSTLTPLTAAYLHSEVCKTLEQVKSVRFEIEHARMVTRKAPPAHLHLELQRNTLLRYMVGCREGRKQWVLKPLLASFTAEQLLTLSALCGTEPAYDYAMKEIHRRMPVG